MKEFEVNDFITLKLENGESNIYVNGELFNQCKYILVQRRVGDLTDLSEVESIDELAFENLDHMLEDYNPVHLDITEETQFWVHCSNLQVWVENNYDTRMLHSNLAFPLLKKLYELGDPIARKVFREEIAKRLKTGFFTVVMYLIEEGYNNYLSHEEFLYSLLNENDAETIGALEVELGYQFKVSFDIDNENSNTIIVEDRKIIGIHVTLIKTPNIFNLLTKLNFLYVLYLESSQIGISGSLKKLKKLQFLYLRNNQLTTIPESLKYLKKIKYS